MKNKSWFLFDARDQILGRLAVKISRILQGKHRPEYKPHQDEGDYVVVINAQKIKVTGKKYEDKMYFRHSGYPRGDRLIKFKDLIASHPQEIISEAVRGMLPHTRLGAKMLRKLKVYVGDKHPHLILKRKD